MAKRRSKKTKQTAKKGCLQKPNYQLQDEKFLTRTENFGTGLWSALRIFYEFMRGFYAFRKVNNCITLFGSARFPETHRYYQTARTMGYMLAEAGLTVMTGGGPGIMEAANRGAQEAHGFSVSCNIHLATPEEELANPYVDKRITFNHFFVRKVMLTKYSSGFIALPGGFGTLDELFEMSTLIQTHKIKNFPLVLMGSDYWSPLVDYIRKTLLKNGTINPDDLKHIFLTDSPADALYHIIDTLKRITTPP
ncbi:MAG TPA: TIGR00730 family Rossman fold protein [Gammaproteobacteria bacterium]|nr:TIGR00730 family Rossman fold protein [Gammaproteobacteria bacterium]